MEAIYEFDVCDMPVAVEVKRTNVHETSPAEWQQRLAVMAVYGMYHLV